ncbi:50S ribosomal protein L11 methyltransferase [Alkalilimnicola sp. S0819]|uniref:50S ribosomal protein L11 methyltransferase n=1 Tax=Alkalilimnicola sp. S0819 TaxID=2613922 RepID=UPI0012629DC7|nr:50S ribosomal protein L11 methyltransferase [Alkalilimnicola sp. S0819]KAB7623027.1 50S ribosomal protein L11 methyltransferase [Alkalilimnicola sp. S0819]MPQ17139.1 50S ribosomal protein L11 methyltransferase [Alkalilimnicola sp. S0819]
MPFLQCALDLEAASAEAVEAAWQELGALSLTLADPGGDPVLEPAVGSTPLWQQLRLIGLFEADQDPYAVYRAAKQALGREPSGWSEEQLEDQPWERAWMDSFHPMRFGKRLWVVPTTVEPPEPASVNLRLDPGLAFGTGTHPTTALCLEWLDGQELGEQDVIDYGCGSGILAVAALLLGARRCLGVDNDPQALIASRENAQRNGVAGALELALPDGAPPRQADVVLANILANILIELAPVLAGRCRAGGRIALSGILREQAEEVARAFAPWFELQPPVAREEWVLISGRRL